METNESGDEDQLHIVNALPEDDDEKTFKYSIVSDDRLISQE